MKQKIGIFLLSALLICSLSACGEMGGAAGDNDILGDEYTTEDNTRQGHSPNNGTNGENYNQKSGNQSTDTRKGVLEPNGSTGINGRNGGNGSSNTGNGTDSRNGKNEGLLDPNGTSYEQMVRNGLVNDTDGDLTDGENPHS